MAAPASEISTDLLLSLSQRLQRLEFHIAGAHEPQDVPRDLKPPVYKRLKTLEHKLKELTGEKEAYRNLLKLCRHLPPRPDCFDP